MDIKKAVSLHQSGRLTEAKAAYKAVLRRAPSNSDAWHFLGVIHAQLGQLPDAVNCMEKAVAIAPNHAEAHFNLGLALVELNRHADAIRCFERALAIKPDYSETHNILGNVLKTQGKLDAAVASYHQALSFRPDFADAHNNLGIALQDQGKLSEAVASFHQALSFRPDFADAHNNLGIAFQEQGELDQAVNSFRGALSFEPNFADAHMNLGLVLLEQDMLTEAVASFHQALSFKPDYADAHNNLGIALYAQSKLGAAIESYRRALLLKPDYAEVYNNLGNALRDYDMLDAAIESYRKALAFKPDYAAAYSNLLFTMQFRVAESPSELRAEHARFAAQFEAPLRTGWQQHRNTQEPGRRLKVGYVSPDFRRHAVAYFIEPVLANHDKNQIEVCCYYNHTRHDEFTDRLAGYADHWLDCKRMTDGQLADRIRADGIDILVDLAGHTAHNRMLTLARKPAPIQITYLGYPGTSGLSAMDYRLTDNCADPQSSEANYTESLLRLPDSLWCYRPGKDMPEISALPAQQNGYITFGSFNNFNKIDSRCIELWTQLLQAVPNSRLLMVTVPEGESTQRLTGQFAAHGVAPERLEFHGKLPGKEFHQMLKRADMTLDPVTVNGATTTCESLWLGVPVISLVGTRFLERAGFSILSAAGLPDFAAATPQGCINVATRLAENLPRLAELRMGLRTRVASSPLRDEMKFTQNLEEIYREIWTKWCSTVA